MNKPLADRFRPQSLEDIVGQKHLLAEGKPLRRIIESGEIPNLIFYGPSGVGKTTLATYIANKTNKTLRKLNGTTASTADIKEIVAQLGTFSGINGILLYLDEIQYFNKKQQQTLLEYIENGSITLIASTTENPYFYVYNAILSRSTVFEFKSVEPDEIEKAVYRAAKLLGEEQVDGVGGHAHVVIHGAVRVDLPFAGKGAVQDAADDLHIHPPPVPDVADHHLQLAVPAKVRGVPVVVVRVIGGHRVAGDDLAAGLAERLHGISRQAGPAQHYFRPWICHLHTKCKRIDICRVSDNRIVGDIAYGVILRHSSGNSPGNELALIHPAVVHSHAGIRL